MFGDFEQIKAIYEFNKNGYEVYCQDYKHLKTCLEKEIIAKQDVEPFLYNSLLTHYWRNKGNSCMFRNREEYENSRSEDIWKY